MRSSIVALLDRIYDAALDPAQWPETLTLVSEYIGASFMSVVPYDDPASIFMSKGGEHAMAGYTEHWFALDTMVKVGIRHKHSRRLICDWSSIGLETIEKDSYYQDFRREVGIGYCLGTTFEAFPNDFRALGINLPLGRKPLDPQDLEDIEGLLGHLARSMTISSRTMDMQATLPAFRDVLDRIRCGAAIVDASGRVIVANQALRDMSGEGLRIVSNRIACGLPECQARLDRLVLNSFDRGSIKKSPDYASIRRPSGRRPFMARVAPLSDQSAEGIWRTIPSRRQSLLLIVDLANEETFIREIALRALGLTVAEAKVAALVGGGLSPRQAAVRLGSTEGTVRNQLKQVFSKLELRRQSDLVRIVNRIGCI